MAPTTNCKHILIVDDELEIREILSTVVLGLHGFEPFTAANGEEALKIVKNQKIDLLITDLSMPVINGFELLRRLKNLNFQIPTVVLTGHSDHKVMKLLLSFGVNEFLNKPWDNDQLIWVLKKLLVPTGSSEKAS